MAHKHSVRDTEAHFTIDQYTRQVKNDSANKTTIVQYDHNSQKLTFELPLYIDGHAMTACDLIEIHFINIATDGKTQNEGTYEVNDITANGETAVFTWLISQEATQIVGSLNFVITFKCTENGETVYRWSTEICKTLAVSDGMDNGESVLTEYPDILAQWKSQLFSASETAVVNVATAEASALANIEAAGEAKKQSVLDAIPDEYEELSALADNNFRNKAGAIVLEAEGENIVLSNASAMPLQNLRVFGKSTQNGTPTPEVPVDIVSKTILEVLVHGGNLIPYPYADGMSKTMNGITYTVNEDGSILVNGTATDNSNFTMSTKSNVIKLPKGWVSTSLGIGFGSDVVQIQNDIFKDGVYFTTIQSQTESAAKRKFETDVEFSGSRIKVAAGVTVNNVLVYPVFCLAENAIPYERFVQKQAMKLVHTLHGVPVPSGGNYTDVDGQQWICDEVDLARGVYVQRVTHILLNGTESWGVSNNEFYCAVSAYSTTNAESAQCICTHYPAVSRYELSRNTGVVGYVGVAVRDNYIRLVDNVNCSGNVGTLKSWLADRENPVGLLYILATPIETPLSDAEINAFRAMHTNTPNTTVLNDSSVHMAVEYVADTKTYIDNKIAELLSQ